MSPTACDPVTLELIGCRLTAGARQMAAALWKSSYSTVIREVLDYSTAIFDERGQMVAQSAQLPFQMMTMSAPLSRLVGRGYDWRPGDVVLLNDPYACDAQHLPDFMTFRPIFRDGRLVAFTGAVAHMIDTGGGAPGSYLADATEIYHEGLRLPPVKVLRGGEKNAEVLDIIALNVREPDKVLGDLGAMIASTAIGERAVQELLDRHGADVLGQALQTILDTSEAQFRHRLRAVPPGTYRAVDFVDDDGISTDPIRLELALTFRDGTAVADFTGSAPQVRGPVNATREMTVTSVCYTLMAALGQGVPKNDGCRRAVEVVVPPRTVLSAGPPAPVASRVTTCHRVVDVALQALAPAVPDRVMAGYYGVSSICNLGGQDPHTGRPWVHFEIEVGGWGGRPTADGLDGFSAHVHNVANTPVEVVEQTAPLRVERYEFRADSGGAGRHRGGLGLRRDVRVLCAEASLNLLSDHCKFPPRGLLGGGDGAPGCYVLNPGTPEEAVLPDKVSNYRVGAGDVISMQTPGGGGYGDPADRGPARAAQDRREGKVTQ
jgi:N-methylhydantoinase B